jgi:hypothetical protein
MIELSELLYKKKTKQQTTLLLCAVTQAVDYKLKEIIKRPFSTRKVQNKQPTKEVCAQTC